MKIKPKNRFRKLNLANLQKAKGFSLFELVVFIILIAIIYATAANRFAEFPAQAERANFLAITTQLQTAINLEMMIGIGSGRIRSAQRIDGVNPMDFMMRPPSNYLGAFDLVNRDRIERRAWYFDREARELVYLVGYSNDVYLLLNGREVPTDEIRFRIIAEFGVEDRTSGLPISIAEANGNIVEPENRQSRLKGVLLRPVFPFKWGEEDATTLVGQATQEVSSL